jgi:hypothetical protein
MENLTIYGLQNNISFCESQGLAKCFQAYAENCTNDDIFEIGFNPNSGFTYIALEIGITICSMLGREVEFLVTDNETGNEHFFNNYEAANKFLQLNY